MSAILKVQERGQVTLPKELRQRLQIEPGTLLICTDLRGGIIHLTPVPKVSFEEMFGSWREQPPTDGTEVEEEIRRAMEAAAGDFLSATNG